MKPKYLIALAILAAFAAGVGVGVLVGHIGRVKIGQGETSFKAYMTGYGYWDNTPPGSAAVAFPKSKGFSTAHDQAGGSGTFNDPVTLAVGHSLTESGDTPDFEPGTIFYIPDFKKYFVVEDICGDGPDPQVGSCHSGFQNYTWLDLWVGGESDVPKDEVTACEDRITGLHTVILSPSPHYPVFSGAILRNAPCA